MEQQDRTQDIPLERGIIAAILAGAEITEAIDTLSAEYFSQNQLREIYLSCLDCLNTGNEIEIITVSHKLRERQSKVQPTDLLTFAEMPKTNTSLLQMSEQLREVWQLRRLEKLGRSLISGYIKNPVELAYQQISEIMQGQTTQDAIEAEILGPQVHEQLTQRIKARNNLEPMPGLIQTGFSELDKMNAVYAGEMSVWAGRPGMGKTALMMNLALNMAETGTPVFIYSLEIPGSVLAEKMICILAQINYLRSRAGTLTENEFNAFDKAAKRFAALDITFSEENGLTGVIASLRRWRMRRDKDIPSVAFVDYVQRVHNDIGRGNREQEIAGISRALTDFAKKNNTHMALLAQLSRAVEQRGGNMRPRLSDLRESGQLEQDASLIIFPFRPEYYDFTTDDEGNSTEGQMILDVQKFRSGPQGEIKLQFTGKYQQIADWKFATKPF